MAMSDSATTETLTQETAQLLAAAAAETGGVSAVAVCSREGDVLAGSGAGDLRKEAALASYIVQRVESLAQDGDLRGMGRSVASGVLEEIILSGRTGDGVLLSFPDCHVLVSLRPGVSGPPTVASLRNISRRYIQVRGTRGEPR
jgi:hypothetical protein